MNGRIVDMTLHGICLAAIMLLGAQTAAADPAIGRQLVVFDIDGTLTPHNLFVREARPGAAEVVATYVAQGYHVIYLTTRIPSFQSGLSAWLARHGFPAAPLHVAQSREERRDPVAFKAKVLEEYAQSGWQLAWAYGDSPTDFAAYARAGIPKERVFALRRRFAPACADGVYQACLDGWLEHRHLLRQ